MFKLFDINKTICCVDPCHCRLNRVLGIVGGTIKSFARRERPSPANELRRGTIPKAILVNIEEKVEPAPPDDDESSLQSYFSNLVSNCRI